MEVVIKESTGLSVADGGSEKGKYRVLFTFPAIPTSCVLSTEFMYIYLALPLDGGTYNNRWALKG
jgi:hypothetical protein